MTKHPENSDMAVEAADDPNSDAALAAGRGAARVAAKIVGIEGPAPAEGLRPEDTIDFTSPFCWMEDFMEFGRVSDYPEPRLSRAYNAISRSAEEVIFKGEPTEYQRMTPQELADQTCVRKVWLGSTRASPALDKDSLWHQMWRWTREEEKKVELPSQFGPKCVSAMADYCNTAFPDREKLPVQFPPRAS